MGDYQVVRDEIAKFKGADLTKKREVIVLTKTDTRDEAFIKEAAKRMQTLGKPVLTVSVIDDAATKALGDELVSLLRKGE
jgi:GTPase involved in cell partitioning and DNA repair